MATENLNNQEAIDKLKYMVNSIDIGMIITTQQDNSYPYMVPMSRQEVDDEGNIWYLLSSTSETYKNIQLDNKVSISLADVSNYKFLSIDAVAETSTDKERIEKYWNKFVEVYFEKGKEDPTIRVLKVIPNNAHYWDTETNKLFNFFKVASAAITGAKIDIGREGEINL